MSKNRKLLLTYLTHKCQPQKNSFYFPNKESNQDKEEALLRHCVGLFLKKKIDMI